MPETVAAQPLQTDSDSTLLLDVRTPAEFQAARVPGSVNVPLDQLHAQAAGLVSLCGDRPVTLLCASGQRSESARKILHAAGITQARVAAGGLAGWEDDGGTVARDPVASAPDLQRQVRTVAGFMVLAGSLLGLLVNPWFHGLSLFAGAGLAWSGLTGFCGMARLLAWLPFNR